MEPPQYDMIDVESAYCPECCTVWEKCVCSKGEESEFEKCESALAAAKEQVARYTKKPDEYCSREQWIMEVGRWERRIAEIKGKNRPEATP